MTMAKKKITTKIKITVSFSVTPLLEVARYMHEYVVRICYFCGKPMSRSDVNDYGSLCETCYMKEYYG